MFESLDNFNTYRAQGRTHSQAQRSPPTTVNERHMYTEMPSTAMEFEAIAALVAAARHPVPINADDGLHSPGHHLAIPRTPAMSNNTRVTNNSLSAPMMFDGQTDIPIDPGLTMLESEQAAHLLTTAAVPSSEGVEGASVAQLKQRGEDARDEASSELSAPASDDFALDPDWNENAAAQNRSQKRFARSFSATEDVETEGNDGTSTATPSVSKGNSTAVKNSKSTSKRKKSQNEDNGDGEGTPSVKKPRKKGKKTRELERRLHLVESELARHKAREDSFGSEDEVSGSRRNNRGKKKSKELQFKEVKSDFSEEMICKNCYDDEVARMGFMLNHAGKHPWWEVVVNGQCETCGADRFELIWGVQALVARGRIQT